MTLQLNITGVEDLFIYTGVFTGGKVIVNLTEKENHNHRHHHS